MTFRRRTSTCISIATISLLLLFVPQLVRAQRPKALAEESVDSTKFFQGFSVGLDLVGIIQKAVSSYGQYEGAVRVNLKDRYFPVFEFGVGSCSHDEETTQMHYETRAPYFRVGMDFNMMKNKHDIYRLYAGARYGFSSFKYDVSHPPLTDPYWGDDVPYGAEDVKCTFHWIEAVFGVEAKIWGPFHLGWSARYRHRLKRSIASMDNCWYVPGYGREDKSNFGGTFHVIIDI